KIIILLCNYYINKWDHALVNITKMILLVYKMKKIIS
ncbi:uncharacterized protein METZ01_LOCUS152401, partial [marine metagenome]